MHGKPKKRTPGECRFVSFVPFGVTIVRRNGPTVLTVSHQHFSGQPEEIRGLEFLFTGLGRLWNRHGSV
jgi:hypothetical protein